MTDSDANMYSILPTGPRRYYGGAVSGRFGSDSPNKAKALLNVLAGAIGVSNVTWVPKEIWEVSLEDPLYELLSVSASVKDASRDTLQTGLRGLNTYSLRHRLLNTTWPYRQWDQRERLTIYTLSWYWKRAGDDFWTHHVRSGSYNIMGKVMAEGDYSSQLVVKKLGDL